MSASINISGQRFGRLIAIKPVGIWKSRTNKNTSVVWECRCDCGNIVRVRKNQLGRCTNSCGCLKKDTAKTRGMSNRGKRSLPIGVSSKNKLYNKYKRQAANRGLAFELSMEQFEKLTQADCYYCGTQPHQTTKDRGANGQYIYNGIDRVNNTKGYISNNCVPCCGTCNRAKLAMPLDEFYRWILRVYNKTILKSSLGISK